MFLFFFFFLLRAMYGALVVVDHKGHQGLIVADPDFDLQADKECL